MKLRPVRYQMKSDEENTQHVGFVAQEIQDIIPESVFGSGKMEDPSHNPLTLSYNGITAALTKAVQQLKMMFDEIEGKVEQVIGSVDQVFKHLKQLTDRIDAQDKEIKMLKEAILQQQK